MTKSAPVLILSAAMTVAASSSMASEQRRELGAHEHGVGALNLAFEGQNIAMELEAPGADIVGFEHPAESAEDRARIEEAIATLSKPLDLFVFPADAGCQVTEVNVELMTEGHDHDGHDGHDDHDDSDHDGEAHADHHDDSDHDSDHKDDEHDHDSDHESEDHADHDDSDHDSDHEGEDHAAHDDSDHDSDHEGEDHADHDDHDDVGEAGHTEFHAEYALTCSSVGEANSITFAYFEAFPNARELEIQLISSTGSAGFEVERDEPELDLSGQI